LIPKQRQGGWPFSVFLSENAQEEQMTELKESEFEPLYCPLCKAEVPDPLVCGDCGAVICRRCGTPLEKVDELGIG
jgi:hypothetical protein